MCPGVIQRNCHLELSKLCAMVDGHSGA
jgi:hypothetical protein